MDELRSGSEHETPEPSGTPSGSTPPPPPPPPPADATPPLGSTGSPYAAPVADTRRPPASSDTARLLAAVGYPFWPVALVALLLDPYRDEPFVRFHAVQALGLNVAIWLVVVLLGGTVILSILSGVAALAGFVYEIVFAIRAYSGDYAEVPVVYGLVRSWVGE